MGQRRNLYKDDKIPGGGRRVDFIQKSKVANFVKLFKAIQKTLGNYELTRIRVGLSHKTMSEMKNLDILSASAARKILDTYNEICVKEN